MKRLIKIIFLLWSPDKQTHEERHHLLIEKCGEEVKALGVHALVMYVNDADSNVRSPAPKPLFEKLISAHVEVWVDDISRAQSIEKILKENGFTCAGYRVEESIYREYGGNPHMKKRDWPDGTRSPGVVSVNLLTRPKKYNHDEWIERWFSIMSPVSEAIQPRGRYVRNVVLESVTADAPVYDGIVIEAWPSKKHVSNLFLFYGAGNIFQLIKNIYKVLRAVRSFLKVRDVRTVMMSEYFVKSGYEK